MLQGCQVTTLKGSQLSRCKVATQQGWQVTRLPICRIVKMSGFQNFKDSKIVTLQNGNVTFIIINNLNYFSLIGNSHFRKRLQKCLIKQFVFFLVGFNCKNVYGIFYLFEAFFRPNRRMAKWDKVVRYHGHWHDKCKLVFPDTLFLVLLLEGWKSNAHTTKRFFDFQHQMADISINSAHISPYIFCKKSEMIPCVGAV